MAEESTFRNYDERVTKQDIMDHVMDQLADIDESKLQGIYLVLTVDGETTRESDTKIMCSAEGRFRMSTAFEVATTVAEYFGNKIEGFKDFCIGKAMTRLAEVGDPLSRLRGRH
jgi:hypothetical protein